jgi:LPS O-antigen subunit length determinant protein (WzzB/FepE family)
MEDLLINKVSESALLTLNLEEYYPKEAIVLFDMKDHLFMGLILKEKDFREALKNIDLAIYTDKAVAVTCSADAVIPIWAYMLVASYLQPVAKEVIFGTEQELKNQLLLKNIEQIKLDEFTDKRVVIKGCGELPVGEAAYLKATKILRPVVKSIMYGEPCSTVPIFKKK